jgi:hypothetical protein
LLEGAGRKIDEWRLVSDTVAEDFDVFRDVAFGLNLPQFFVFQPDGIMPPIRIHADF